MNMKNIFLIFCLIITNINPTQCTYKVFQKVGGLHGSAIQYGTAFLALGLSMHWLMGSVSSFLGNNLRAAPYQAILSAGSLGLGYMLYNKKIDKHVLTPFIVGFLLRLFHNYVVISTMDISNQMYKYLPDLSKIFRS